MSKVQVKVELKDRKNLSMVAVTIDGQPIDLSGNKWSGELEPDEYDLGFTVVGGDGGSVKIIVSQGDTKLLERNPKTSLTRKKYSNIVDFVVKG